MSKIYPLTFHFSIYPGSSEGRELGDLSITFVEGEDSFAREAFDRLMCILKWINSNTPQGAAWETVVNGQMIFVKAEVARIIICLAHAFSESGKATLIRSGEPR